MHTLAWVACLRPYQLHTLAQDSHTPERTCHPAPTHTCTRRGTSTLSAAAGTALATGPPTPGQLPAPTHGQAGGPQLSHLSLHYQGLGTEAGTGSWGDLPSPRPYQASSS